MKGGDIMAIVYHGTNRLFKEFDKSQFLTGEGYNIWGEGFYFALDKNIALEYAKTTSKRYLISPSGEEQFDLNFGLDIKTIDECVACVIKTLEDAKSNGEEYGLEEVIKSTVELNCFSLKNTSIRPKRIKEVTARYNQVKNWKKNSGFLYSVEIDNEYIKDKHLTKLYNSMEDGICLIVNDPTIIKIVDVEEIPYLK